MSYKYCKTATHLTVSVKVTAVAKGSKELLISEGLNIVQQSLFTSPSMPLSNLLDRSAVLCVDRSECTVGYLHDFLALVLEG